MNRRITATGRTLARTRWLSELAEALERASKIALELGREGSADERVALLSVQIGALLKDVETLRRAKPASAIKPRPDWIKSGAR